MRTSPCPHHNHDAAGHRSTRQVLVDEHLAEADQIVRELFPEAVSIVFADERPEDQGVPRIAHILGAHGVLLYSPDDNDLLHDLVRIHLADAAQPQRFRECG